MAGVVWWVGGAWVLPAATHHEDDRQHVQGSGQAPGSVGTASRYALELVSMYISPVMSPVMV